MPEQQVTVVGGVDTHRDNHVAATIDSLGRLLGVASFPASGAGYGDGQFHRSLHGEVRLAWHAKETLRGLYDIDCPQLAATYATELVDDLQDADCPPELRRLGRTLARWHTQIVNWHHARVSNGPTEAINNLIKRVKRAAFGFRRFAHYRIRALLYAGKPNWNLLNSLTPR